MASSEDERPDERAQEEAREAGESAADLAQGQLPLQAQKRLEQETGARPLFSTDLNVGEFLLARDEGYDAVGQVMGSSIYQVGWQYAPGFTSSELTVVTQAHMEARGLALGRMQQEATALHAHGVVGVRLTTRSYEWGPGLLEFTAIGTAVRLRGAPAPSTPFLSDLSGEDFWTLIRSGYLPRGLAMGFSAYFVYGYGTGWSFGNQELTVYTDGVYQARRNAMRRVQSDLVRLGADGVVGVKVETRKEFVSGDDKQPAHLRIEFFALGTAIVVAPQRPRPATPSLVLNMTGLRPVRPRLEGAELRDS